MSASHDSEVSSSSRRFALLPVERLTPEQRKLYDAIRSGPRSKIAGEAFAALLHGFVAGAFRGLAQHGGRERGAGQRAQDFVAQHRKDLAEHLELHALHGQSAKGVGLHHGRTVSWPRAEWPGARRGPPAFRSIR